MSDGHKKLLQAIEGLQNGILQEKSSLRELGKDLVAVRSHLLAELGPQDDESEVLYDDPDAEEDTEVTKVFVPCRCKVCEEKVVDTACITTVDGGPEIIFSGERWLLPERATSGAAGFDLRAANAETVFVGDTRNISTGLRVIIPQGYVGFVVIRSGMSHALALTNGVGVIDSDYRGEIFLPLQAKHHTHQVRAGDRIAQLIVVPYLAHYRHGTEEAIENAPTERGEGGFGSTGVR